jgi:Cu-Zn family superoxide dismutase
MLRAWWFRTVRALFVLIASIGCASTAPTLGGAGSRPERSNGTASSTTTTRASANLQPAFGSLASGTVEMTKNGDGTIHLTANLDGLAPGAHEIMVHERGDCSAPDASSAGENVAHGKLPALIADANGHATMDVDVPELALQGRNGVVGRSIVVHADPGSAARVACGVVVATAWQDITDRPPPPASVRVDDVPGFDSERSTPPPPALPQ